MIKMTDLTREQAQELLTKAEQLQELVASLEGAFKTATALTAEIYQSLDPNGNWAFDLPPHESDIVWWSRYADKGAEYLKEFLSYKEEE